MSITSDTLSILEDNLKSNILLYTPEIIYSENQEPSPVDYFDDHLPYNKVTLVIKPGEFIEINFEKPNLTGISTKNILLRENLFILMDAKNELSSDRFILLAEEYVKVLKLVLDYSVDAIYSLKGNFKNNLPAKILLGFEAQSKYLNEHYSEFVKRFGFEAEEVDVTSDNSNNLENDQKTLSHYLKSKNSKKIEEIIIKNFKGKKGKPLRCIIEYFIRNNIVTLEHGNQNELYLAFQNTFKTDIGVPSGMWGYKVDRTKDKSYLKIRNSLEILLKGLI